MAEVTMSLQEYSDIQHQRDVALNEAAELRKQLAKAQLADPTGTVPRLVEGVEAALPVVKFATGNLDPRTVRGWPYEDLQTFADVLDKLPGVNITTRECALEFRNFILEARAVEAERYSRDAAALNGNATLTLVFEDQAARDKFMGANELELPEGLSETRRKYYVCPFESAPESAPVH